MILIIDTILTPYEVARYNAIHKQLKGQLKVWFQLQTQPNRNWKQFPKINFDYYISSQLLNLDLISLLHQKSEQFSRIIVCGWNTPMYWYSLIFAKFHAIRFTVWSGSTVYEKSALRLLFSPMVKLFVSKCNDFIAYGTRAKDYLENLGAPKEYISLYYNSVDIGFFHKKAVLLGRSRKVLRQKYQIPTSRRVLLFVGQLIERKGVMELVHAFLSLGSQHPLSLVLVGSGPLKDDIRRIIKENPTPSIRLIDHVEYFQMPEIYAFADVLILPSKTEVWGLVVNEAMASMLPVIVSRRAGCAADLIREGNTGYLLEPTQRGILRAIRMYSQKSIKELYRIGYNAYIRVNNLSRHNRLH